MTSPQALPTPQPLHHGMARRALWTVGACVLIAVFLHTLLGDALGVSLVYSLSIGLSCWALIDVGRGLAVRWRLARDPGDVPATQGWPGWGWMSALIGIGTVLGFRGGSRLGAWLSGQPMLHHGPLQHDGFAPMMLVTLTVGLLLTIVQSLQSRRLLAEAEAEAVRRLAAETRLKLLESQLEPHMLFNTLANLRVLIDLDPPRAGVMLDHLIDFLRATLQGSRVAEHALTDEFARLRDYLALMQVRMGERLESRFELPPELAALPVPALLLQPLVENAIRHGLEPSVDGGRLTVRAEHCGERLRLTVHDTGVGLGPTPPASALPPGTGFGLDQVRERLRTLHGDQAQLTLQAAPDGTLACVELPLPAAFSTSNEGEPAR
ncbi:Histidine kinase-, DNA gyrase B-, and HSP90-like ATPase [Sphaerotilus natans]|nr:histidine kinase [Sphaerotilus natans]SIR27191.1 Histidine kinase-, DNA gyrase B-, and HSP90-like ATPase [Sphaerotilus natans]